MISPEVCIYVIQSRDCDLRHQNLSKHPANPYSFERACHKLSKTPSLARIGAVGGPHHHSECTTRALSDPNRARQDRAARPGHQG